MTTAANKIAALMAACDMSERQMSEAAAIARPTFRRRMVDGDWTVRELERIAGALGADFSAVLPDSLASMTEAGVER